MSDPEEKLKVLETHTIKCPLGLDRDGIRGGLIVGGEYAWFTNGADIVLYSKTTGCVESSRSFGQTDISMKITFVQELHKSEETMNMLLVGCSCKSFGILFVCQLPSLSIIRCIHTPSPISYISTINNETLVQDQLCDEFKVMSTILLVGLATGAVFAVDLRKRHIENRLRSNEIVVNESSPSKLFILRKNEFSQEIKKMSDDSDFHLAIFINENFCNFFNKQCSDKLNIGISCLLYTEEINTVAIGYITGHFQLWDCKIMQTLYVIKTPECLMPISHITFLKQADDPHKLCYLWIVQSDHSRLPNAMMLALSYEHRTLMSNGRCSYRVYKEYNIKLKMSLPKDSGIGRCISALTLCNDTLVRKSTDMSENCGITLFTMLMEIRQNVDASPKFYVFMFDINQWYKAQMPSVINNLKVSESYASFLKLPDNASYLDFNISDKTLRPFGYNFRNNVEELYYPSSIYFECDCLSDTKIIRFKHVGLQQEVLDKLILKNWSSFLNPSLLFDQYLQKNLKPFFWDKTYDYKNYSVLDKLHFVISIIVENNTMSVIDECAEKWKNGTHSEVLILHLVQYLWNHVMLVKQYADKLCVPLFDCSDMMLDGKKNVRMLKDCLSQMLCVENFFKHMQLTDCVQITNVDLVDRVKIINLVTQYFNAIIYFDYFQLLPKQIEEDATHQIIQCDFTSLIQYACKRRMEFGDLPLYLIDAFVTNEPNGNKLIEQWKHECIEETKGLYPPSDVQCLLRIYLNAELSNQIKDFITIYFLIDVCSVQKMNEITANIFNSTFVKNEELYKLCCASWLFDHDMLEDAMLILASNNEWMVDDESWNWYHWTVLKLFDFKKQYHWAQIYLELFNVKLVNLDEHKFYVNLQIMNNCCFDALHHLHLRTIEDKKILFEYIFDRCRHTNQLKALLSYPMDSDEKKLFFSCLKKFEDTNSIQFLFLVQERRYSEALEVYKLLKIKTNSKHNYILEIASVLVNKIKDNISPNNKNYVNKKVFSNEEIQMKFENCSMDNHNNMKKSNILRNYRRACQNHHIVPDVPDDDIVCSTRGLDEKVSTINGVLSPSKIETVKQIETQLLKLLDTPFIQNINYIPSASNYSVVPKKKSATDNKQLSTMKLDKMPQTLKFGLPDNNDIKVEKFSHKVEGMSMKKIDSENEIVVNSDINNLPINIIMEPTMIISHKLHKDNSGIELLETVPISYTVDEEEDEEMDSSDCDEYGTPNGENEYNFEDSDIILGDLNDTNNSEQSDDLLDDNLSVENHSNDTSIMPDDENEGYLKELDIILESLYNNNSEQPVIEFNGDIDENLEESEDLLYHDISVENHSDLPIVIPDSEDNLGEPYVILKGEQFEYVEEPDILVDLNGSNNSGESDDLPNDVNVENNLDQPNVLGVLPGDENEGNLKESNFILEGENFINTNQTDFILDDLNDMNNSDLLDDNVNVENQLAQQSRLADGKDEDNLKKPETILDNANDTNNSKEPDIILESKIDGHFEESEDLLDGKNEENVELFDDDVNAENRSDQPCAIPNGENEDDTNDSEQPDVILEGNISEHLENSDDFLDDDQSVENQSDQPSLLTDDENKDNKEEPDFILRGENYGNVYETDILMMTNDDASVQNHSDQLSVKPDVILDRDDKENSEETYASEQNLIQLFETFKNEKTPKNNEMVDLDNVIYQTDSQSNALENLTPCNNRLTEENRLNCDKQIEEENINLCNIVEYTNEDTKSNEPINFQIVKSPKDLCSDQNKDYLYYQYQYSNNDIFSELSTVENPIPEYGFNHLTMTGNESSQLEVYYTLNQPTSVLLNESFLNNTSLVTTAKVNETHDLVVNNNVEIVTDEISVDLEPSSSITNLYDQEIKSFQLVNSKHIAPQQVSINTLNSATEKYAIEKLNISPLAISSEPSKTLIIEEFLPNSIFHNDILVQEETSKLVNFVKSNSDTEIDNFSENVFNLRTHEENKQPLIEQLDKNIPNLRKRRGRLTDTKLITKSKSESKTIPVELVIISSNISSPTSNTFEDCLVSMSKKRSKSEKKTSVIKRRRVCPKYVASIDGASNSKLDLKQSEKNTVNKDTESQKKFKKLKKLTMSTETNLDFENNKILNQNNISSSKMFEQLFLLVPKVVLESFDVSSFKNSFKQLAVPSNNDQVTLSTNKTNSRKPVASKRLRNRCSKSIKEPTAINTIIDKELKEDSINNYEDKAVTKKSKLNSPFIIKKVELDKKMSSLNKIHNNLINETINLISNDKFVSDEILEEMGITMSDKNKLNWKIISHEVKANTNAIPKIRIGRNKSELHTKCVGSPLDLKAIKQGTKIVQESLINKSSETNILELSEQGRRTSSRKISKKLTCSCCTNKSTGVAHSSTVL